MQMSQVWSKADFDGLNETGHKGGYGSVLAVTGQNPGPDGQFNTADDVLAPLNVAPVDVSIDASPGPVCGDPMDRSAGSTACIPAARTSSSPTDRFTL